MKILHIITSLKIGGAERALCNLIESLSNQRGFQHFVAYFHHGPHVDTLKKLNIPRFNVGGRFFTYDPWTYQNLTKLIRTLQPDIIHTSLWSANILGRIIGFRYNIPVISDLHGNCIDEGRLRNILDRYTAHIPQAIVAVSDSVQKTYQEHIIQKIAHKSFRLQAQKNLITIRNGINSQALTMHVITHPLTRHDVGIPDNAFVIGAIGRLEPIKSYSILIRAFARVTSKNRPLHLMIVGDGSERQKLEALCRDHSIKNVHFSGMHSDVYRFYPLFDCFALSSQSEGLSIALLEAMSFGLPIITTHQTMQHDVITHGINGLIVTPNNIDGFAQAIGILLKSPDLCNTMKGENLDSIKKNFHITQTADAYAQIFKNALTTSKTV